MAQTRLSFFFFFFFLFLSILYIYQFLRHVKLQACGVDRKIRLKGYCFVSGGLPSDAEQ